MGELRLAGTALRVVDVMRATGWGDRTAYRYVAAWAAVQERRADVPRVAKVRTGSRGRPPWRIDAESFFRWWRCGANSNAVAND
jgi:hypothetical protein